MANPINPRPSNRTHLTATISTAADGLSETVNLTGHTLSAIQMSTAWTAAHIGFNVLIGDSTTHHPLYNTTGNHLTYPTSANRVISFDPAVFAGIQKLQLASKTTAGVAVAQAAARLITLSLA